MRNWHIAIYNLLSSIKFFWIVLGLFIFQALWIGLSAIYPMAFDEAYHFGVIQVYASQWLPFLPDHPEGADAFAAMHRYPSYFFHYLLSWPYRILDVLTDNQVAQIIALRLINIGIFVYALVIFRKLFLKLKVSPALTHISLLLFTLIPIVPLLAAHINYDNLLILLVAWTLVLAVDITKQLKQQKIPIKNLLILAVVAVFAAITKYAVLPILAATAAFLLIYGLVKFKDNLASMAEVTKASWGNLSTKAKLLLPLLLLLGMGLAFERYGLNLIQYQTLMPSCDEVISHEQCMEFGPYERNYYYDQDIDPEFTPSLSEHIGKWHSGMWYRLFFMINGDVEVDRYQNFSPLPLMSLGFTAVFLLGLVATTVYARSIFRNRPDLWLILAVAAFYCLVLWLNNYSSYTSSGRIIALNGRYLLLVIPSVIAIMGLGLSRLFKDRLKLKVASCLIALVLVLQGGGLTSFLIRSSETWYWPNYIVWQVNQATENAVSPVIFGSDEDYLNFVPR